jgi:ubiquinone/menaquinone biosynthesis C-methylase UbiE
MFRVDLYRGTAPYYDRYRLPYPRPLVDDLVDRVNARGDGRLLDLACGTGQVTFPLASHFADVWAIDQEPETVAFARDKARDAGVANVRWIAGRAEDVDPAESFDVVTVGTAFHRLPRRRVAALAMRWLRPGGHLALLWSSTPADGSAPWQQEFRDCFARWITIAGATERLPAGLEQELADHPHARILREAGFDAIERREFVEPNDWDLASLAGYVYSTSVLSLAALGERSVDFEADLEQRLLAIEPSGRFRDDASYAYDLARNP